jgi:hypothetical protein
VGGYKGPPTPPEVYDTATGMWTVIGDPARPGTLPLYRSATLLSDGTVLLTDAPNAALYDPGIGSWTATATMLAPRRGGPTSTLLLDGTVLVAGGYEGGDECPAQCGPSSAELYVPAGVSPPSAVLALPSSATTPIPTPSPTPIPPAVGPVPPGARTWTVKVVNMSSQPATLFVADEDDRGAMAQLVGSATPNIVPAGATVRVTFAIPAKGVEGWSIYVNPGPDDGGLVGWDNLPADVEIHINEFGIPTYGSRP